MAVVCKVVFFAAILIGVLQAEKYTAKWDNINVDEILSSERLLKNYMNCLMERGSCTPDGAELKKNLPDALETDCSKCTDKQKENTEKVVDFLIIEKPDWWEELQKKYDPTGIYYEKKKDVIEERTKEKREKKEKAKKE
ncbi:UNVERIFIED_CONTAM: hypothetical protein PYX00_000471 [Menopon gallinae]|uniref:Uncharacterized protein n=1 Tax=Menopon gallinae TaxID=328185 RepID=A0AAW2IBA4_9NEOP